MNFGDFSANILVCLITDNKVIVMPPIKKKTRWITINIIEVFSGSIILPTQCQIDGQNLKKNNMPADTADSFIYKYDLSSSGYALALNVSYIEPLNQSRYFDAYFRNTNIATGTSMIPATTYDINSALSVIVFRLYFF